MNNKYFEMYSKRINNLNVIIICISLYILSNFFYLQIFNHPELSSQIKKDSIKTRTSIGERGKILDRNKKQKIQSLKLETNFDYYLIQNLFSNLSSLSILELLELRKNYKSLNYSIIEIDIQLLKLISFPIYLVLMTVLSSVIMLSTKELKSSILKISFGLFLSVVIYYLFNFFNVLGKTEKINLFSSILMPLILLTFINLITIRRFNEK